MLHSRRWWLTSTSRRSAAEAAKAAFEKALSITVPLPTLSVLPCHSGLVVDVLSQTEGTRLHKDLKAYLAAVKSESGDGNIAR